MKSVYTLIGVALVFAAITSISLKPALAASSLTVDHPTINQGGTVLITQSETHAGIVKSFKVTLPDGGGVCTAPGGAVSNGHPLSRTFPTDFSPQGGATCNTSLAGTYLAETVVANGGSNGDKEDHQLINDQEDGKDNSGSNQGQDNKGHDDKGNDNGANDQGNGKDGNNEGGNIHVCKVEFDTTFMVLPETSLGAVGIIGSSLAALGGFLYLRKAF